MRKSNIILPQKGFRARDDIVSVQLYQILKKGLSYVFWDHSCFWNLTTSPMETCKSEWPHWERHFYMIMDWIITEWDYSNIPIYFEFSDHFALKDLCSKARAWAVILWFIIRNLYLVFVYCSWHIAPQTLIISYIRAIGASFIIIFGFLFSVSEIGPEP